MTLEEIEAMDRGCITPTIAGAYLGMTKIPRLAFIRWAKGEANEKEEK